MAEYLHAVKMPADSWESKVRSNVSFTSYFARAKLGVNGRVRHSNFTLTGCFE